MQRSNEIPIVQSLRDRRALRPSGVRRVVFCSGGPRWSSLAGIPDEVIHPGTPIDRFLAARSDPSHPGHRHGVPARRRQDRRLGGDGIRRILERLRSNSSWSATDECDQACSATAEPASPIGSMDQGVAFDRLPGLHRSFDVEIAVIADTFGSGSVHDLRRDPRRRIRRGGDPLDPAARGVDRRRGRPRARGAVRDWSRIPACTGRATRWPMPATTSTSGR